MHSKLAANQHSIVPWCNNGGACATQRQTPYAHDSCMHGKLGRMVEHSKASLCTPGSGCLQPARCNRSTTVARCHGKHKVACTNDDKHLARANAYAPAPWGDSTSSNLQQQSPAAISFQPMTQLQSLWPANKSQLHHKSHCQPMKNQHRDVSTERTYEMRVRCCIACCKACCIARCAGGWHSDKLFQQDRQSTSRTRLSMRHTTSYSTH